MARERVEAQGNGKELGGETPGWQPIGRSIEDFGELLKIIESQRRVYTHNREGWEESATEEARTIGNEDRREEKRHSAGAKVCFRFPWREK